MGKACQTNCDESNTSLTTHHTHHTRSADCKVLVNLVILSKEIHFGVPVRP